ncbi:MAG: hypothetical protein QXP36_06355 [Conexivisphaerales archaeon]
MIRSQLGAKRSQVVTEYLVVYALALAAIAIVLSIVSNFFPYSPPQSISGFYNFNIIFYSFNGTTLNLIFAPRGFNFYLLNFSSSNLVSYKCAQTYINASGQEFCELKFSPYQTQALINMYYNISNSSISKVHTEAEVTV